MKKKVLLLGSLSTDAGEDTAMQSMADFMRSAIGADDADVEVFACHIDELGYVINNEQASILDLRNQHELTDYDLVFFRGKLRSAINDVSLVSYFLQKRDIPSRNTAYANRRATGKIPQMYQLHDLGLPIPYTVSSKNENLSELIAKHLQYPVVVKDIHGGHGNNNFLVRSEEDLQKILQEYPDVRFMAQEFIPNDSDYRVLIIGDKELIIQRKAVGDSHLNNTSQGGSAELVEVQNFPAAIIEQSRTYAQYCSYELAGVDVVFNKDTGDYYFLEINSQPQIATGAFVSEKSAMVGEYFRAILGL
jgi:gamma-F420-2:alpha-L-glutamate ligase